METKPTNSITSNMKAMSVNKTTGVEGCSELDMTGSEGLLATPVS